MSLTALSSRLVRHWISGGGCVRGGAEGDWMVELSLGRTKNPDGPRRRTVASFPPSMGSTGISSCESRVKASRSSTMPSMRSAAAIAADSMFGSLPAQFRAAVLQENLQVALHRPQRRAQIVRRAVEEGLQLRDRQRSTRVRSSTRRSSSLGVRGQELLRLDQLALDALALGDVARDFRCANDLARLVAVGRHRQRKLHGPSRQPDHAPRLKMVDALAPADAADNLRSPRPATPAGSTSGSTWPTISGEV